MLIWLQPSSQFPYWVDVASSAFVARDAHRTQKGWGATGHTQHAVAAAAGSGEPGAVAFSFFTALV